MAKHSGNLEWGLAIFVLLALQLVQPTAASSVFFASTLFVGVAAWDQPVYSPTSIDIHVVAIIARTNMAAMAAGRVAGIIERLKGLFEAKAPTPTHANHYFVDRSEPILATETDVATFDDSWRSRNGVCKMVQVAARDALPSVSNHVEQEEIDAEDLSDEILAADQAESENLSDGMLVVDKAEHDFIDIDELTDGLMAVDRAQYEGTHMAVVPFVELEETVPGAVEATLSREKEMVELPAEKTVAQDEDMADLAVDVAIPFKEKFVDFIACLWSGGARDLPRKFGAVFGAFTGTVNLGLALDFVVAKVEKPLGSLAGALKSLESWATVTFITILAVAVIVLVVVDNTAMRKKISELEASNRERTAQSRHPQGPQRPARDGRQAPLVEAVLHGAQYSPRDRPEVNKQEEEPRRR